LSGLRLPEGVPGANPFYLFMRRFFQVTISLAWKTRVYDRRFEPARGGAVYICNHQSFLDPILMSYALRRPMSYMARDTLFHVPLFKQVITALNAFPVRRGKADTGAMKEAMRRLKAGGQVVVFAEGTRTLDGRIGPFLPGVALLAQRSAEWTVPVVIDGAYEAWPRTQKLPSPGSIVVRYARAIHRDEAREMDAEALVNHVRDVMVAMQAEVRRRAGRPPLEYD
jgi:1-acyl-sn-glycerol-3-phosphate acyltransferase